MIYPFHQIVSIKWQQRNLKSSPNKSNYHKAPFLKETSQFHAGNNGKLEA